MVILSRGSRRWLSFGEIRVSGRLWASLLLFALLLPSFVVAARSVQIGAALTLADSLRLSDLRRAVRLYADNDEIQYQLGIVAFYSTTDPNVAEGMEHLRRAAELNPYSGLYRAQIAAACGSIGDDACVKQNFDRALILSPMVPRIRWLAANGYLRTAGVDSALIQLRALLQMASQPGSASELSAYVPSVFGLCLHVIDPQTVVDKVLPAGSGPALQLEFVDFLSTHDRLEAAYPVWNRVVARGWQFPFSLAKPYLGQLIDARRYDEAESVWQDLKRIGIIHQPRPKDQDELVFNGGFEQAPLNAGFDWRFWDDAYPPVDLSSPAAYQGARCLRIEFNVKRNDEYEPVFQYVPVVSGQRYHLSAYVRTEDITSDSGPRLRVLDPDHSGALDDSTEGTVGTTGWHQVGLTFTAGAVTKIVKLSVWRPRCRSLPYEISGTCWLDDVSLRVAPQPPKEDSGDPRSNARRLGF